MKPWLNLVLCYGALAVADDSVPERLRRLTPGEANRAVAVEMSKAALLSDKRRWGELVIDKWLVKYKKELNDRGENLSADQWRQVMNSAHNRYQAESKLLDDPSQISTRGADFLKLGVKVVTSVAHDAQVPWMGSAQAAAEIGIEAARDLYVAKVGARRQTEHQDQIKEVPFEAERILGAIYDLGMQDSSFKDAYNSSMALTSRAFIGASAKENLDMNVEYHTKLQGEHTDEMATEGNKNTQEVLDLLRNGIDEQGYFKINPKEIQRTAMKIQADLNRRISTGTATVIAYMQLKDRKLRKEENKRQLIAKAFESASASVYLVSGLLRINNPRDAKLVESGGIAAVQIASTIYKFAGDLATQSAARIAMGCVNLAAGIAMAVQGILSALSGPDPTTLILEQIAKLGQQITQLHNAMNERFNTVDRNLGSVFYAVQMGFAEVEHRLQGLQWNQDGIQRSLASMGTAVDQLDAKLFSYLREGFQERVVEEINLCLRLDPNISESEYRRCLERFSTYATQNASNGLAAGSTSALMGANGDHLLNSTTLFWTLDRELKKGIWPNINLVGQVLARNFQNLSLIAPNGKRLVNLEDWALYANRYVDFVASYPGLIKLLPESVRETTDEILSAGAALQTSMSKVGMSSSTTESRKGLLAALDDYSARVDLVKQEVSNSWVVYQQNQLRGFRANLTPDRQEKAARIPFESRGNNLIPPCPDYHLPPPAKQMSAILFPQAFGQFVPQDFHNAEAMGLGKVQVCYEDVGWKDEKEEWEATPMPYDPNSPPNITANVRQITEDGLKNVGWKWDGFRWEKDLNKVWFDPKHYGTFADMAKRANTDIQHVLGLRGSRTWGKFSLKLRTVFEPADGTTKPILVSVREVTSKDYSGKYFFHRVLTNYERYGSNPVMEQTFGKNQAAWPKHQGVWLVSSHNNGWGAEGFDSSQESLLQHELEASWKALATIYSEISVEALPRAESDASVAEIRRIIADRFSKTRTQFGTHLVSQIQNGTDGWGTKRAVDGLNGSKAFLTALYILGFPESVQSHDRLHALIAGADPLLSSSTFESEVAENRMLDESTNLFSNSEAKVAELKTITADLMEHRGGKERNELLSDTQARLEMIRGAVDVGQTQQSVEAALAELRVEVKKLIGKN